MEINEQDRPKLRKFLNRLSADPRYRGIGLDRYAGKSPGVVRGATVSFNALGSADPVATVDLWISEHATDADQRFGVRGIHAEKGRSNPARVSFRIQSGEAPDPGNARLLRASVEPFVRTSAELLSELRRETSRRVDDVKASADREVAARTAAAKADASAELLREQLADVEGSKLIGFVRGFTDDLDPDQRTQIGMLFGVGAQLSGQGIQSALTGAGDWFRSLAERNRGALPTNKAPGQVEP